MKSVIEDFQTKKLTFAVSKIGTEFELWREVLSDDKFMEKTDNNIIIYSKNIKIADKLLNSRKFICIWKRGKIVYGEFQYQWDYTTKSINARLIYTIIIMNDIFDFELNDKEYKNSIHNLKLIVEELNKFVSTVY